MELSEVESHGVQMGRCAKCNVLVHASFDHRGSGRKVWDVHLEQAPPEKKKPGIRINGKVVLMILLFLFAIAIIIRTFDLLLIP